jgi:hypothetical protein
MIRRSGIDVICLLILLAAWCVGSNAQSDSSSGNLKVENQSWRVQMVCDSVVGQGSNIVATVVLADTSLSLAGFVLSIEYDRGALVFDSAALGSLTAGEWEYFFSKAGLADDSGSVDPHGLIRLVGLADQQDVQKRTPKPRSLVGPGELVRLYFYVAERKEHLDKATDLRFVWTKCDDNSFSDKSGVILYLSREVYAPDGKRVSGGSGKYAGASGKCFSARRNAPRKYIDFYSTQMTIR